MPEEILTPEEQRAAIHALDAQRVYQKLRALGRDIPARRLTPYEMAALAKYRRVQGMAEAVYPRIERTPTGERVAPPVERPAVEEFGRLIYGKGYEPTGAGERFSERVIGSVYGGMRGLPFGEYIPGFGEEGFMRPATGLGMAYAKGPGVTLPVLGEVHPFGAEAVTSIGTLLLGGGLIGAGAKAARLARAGAVAGKMLTATGRAYPTLYKGASVGKFLYKAERVIKNAEGFVQRVSGLTKLAGRTDRFGQWGYSALSHLARASTYERAGHAYGLGALYASTGTPDKSQARNMWEAMHKTGLIWGAFELGATTGYYAIGAPWARVGKYVDKVIDGAGDVHPVKQLNAQESAASQAADDAATGTTEAVQIGTGLEVDPLTGEVVETYGYPSYLERARGGVEKALWSHGRAKTSPLEQLVERGESSEIAFLTELAKTYGNDKISFEEMFKLSRDYITGRGQADRYAKLLEQALDGGVFELVPGEDAVVFGRLHGDRLLGYGEQLRVAAEEFAQDLSPEAEIALEGKYDAFFDELSARGQTQRELNLHHGFRPRPEGADSYELFMVDESGLAIPIVERAIGERSGDILIPVPGKGDEMAWAYYRNGKLAGVKELDLTKPNATDEMFRKLYRFYDTGVNDVIETLAGEGFTGEMDEPMAALARKFKIPPVFDGLGSAKLTRWLSGFRHFGIGQATGRLRSLNPTAHKELQIVMPKGSKYLISVQQSRHGVVGYIFEHTGGELTPSNMRYVTNVLLPGEGHRLAQRLEHLVKHSGLIAQRAADVQMQNKVASAIVDWLHKNNKLAREGEPVKVETSVFGDWTQQKLKRAVKKVSDLVDKGQTEEARELADTIPGDLYAELRGGREAQLPKITPEPILWHAERLNMRAYVLKKLGYSPEQIGKGMAGRSAAQRKEWGRIVRKFDQLTEALVPSKMNLMVDDAELIRVYGSVPEGKAALAGMNIVREGNPFALNLGLDASAAEKALAKVLDEGQIPTIVRVVGGSEGAKSPAIKELANAITEGLTGVNRYLYEPIAKRVFEKLTSMLSRAGRLKPGKTITVAGHEVRYSLAEAVARRYGIVDEILGKKLPRKGEGKTTPFPLEAVYRVIEGQEMGAFRQNMLAVLETLRRNKPAWEAVKRKMPKLARILEAEDIWDVPPEQWGKLSVPRWFDIKPLEGEGPYQIIDYSVPGKEIVIFDNIKGWALANGMLKKLQTGKVPLPDSFHARQVAVQIGHEELLKFAAAADEQVFKQIVEIYQAGEYGGYIDLVGVLAKRSGAIRGLTGKPDIDVPRIGYRLLRDLYGDEEAKLVYKTLQNEIVHIEKTLRYGNVQLQLTRKQLEALWLDQGMVKPGFAVGIKPSDYLGWFRKLEQEGSIIKLGNLENYLNAMTKEGMDIPLMDFRMPPGELADLQLGYLSRDWAAVPGASRVSEKIAEHANELLGLVREQRPMRTESFPWITRARGRGGRLPPTKIDKLMREAYAEDPFGTVNLDKLIERHAVVEGLPRDEAAAQIAEEAYARIRDGTAYVSPTGEILDEAVMEWAGQRAGQQAAREAIAPRPPIEPPKPGGKGPPAPPPPAAGGEAVPPEAIPPEPGPPEGGAPPETPVADRNAQIQAVAIERILNKQNQDFEQWRLPREEGAPSVLEEPPPGMSDENWAEFAGLRQAYKDGQLALENIPEEYRGMLQQEEANKEAASALVSGLNAEIDRGLKHLSRNSLDKTALWMRRIVAYGLSGVESGLRGLARDLGKIAPRAAEPLYDLANMLDLTNKIVGRMAGAAYVNAAKLIIRGEGRHAGKHVHRAVIAFLDSGKEEALQGLTAGETALAKRVASDVSAELKEIIPQIAANVKRVRHFLHAEALGDPKFGEVFGMDAPTFLKLSPEAQQTAFFKAINNPALTESLRESYWQLVHHTEVLRPRINFFPHVQHADKIQKTMNHLSIIATSLRKQLGEAGYLQLVQDREALMAAIGKFSDKLYTEQMLHVLKTIQDPVKWGVYRSLVARIGGPDIGAQGIPQAMMGQARTAFEAEGWMGIMRMALGVTHRSAARPDVFSAHFLPRVLNLPGWVDDDVPMALYSYFNSVYRYIGETVAFGEHYSKWHTTAAKAISALAAKSPEHAEFVSGYLDMVDRMVLRPAVDNSFMSKVSQVDSAIQNPLKLNLAQVWNISQMILFSGELSGYRNTLETLGKFATNPAFRRAIIERAQYSRVLGEYLYAHLADPGWAAAWNNKVLTVTGFKATDAIARYVSGEAGVLNVTRLIGRYRRLVKAAGGMETAEAKMVMSQLEHRQMLPREVRGWNTITDDVKSAIYDRVFEWHSRETQFVIGKEQLPPFWQTPIAKTAMRYKQFAFMAGKFIKRNVLDEAYRNHNIVPMLSLFGHYNIYLPRLAAAGRFVQLAGAAAVVGEVILPIRKIVKWQFRWPLGEDEDPHIDRLLDAMSVHQGLALKYMWDEALMSNLSKRLWQDVQRGGTFGILGDIQEAVSAGTGGMSSLILGPTGSDLVNMLGGIAYRPEPTPYGQAGTMKEWTRRIGKQTINRLLPTPFSSLYRQIGFWTGLPGATRRTDIPQRLVRSSREAVRDQWMKALLDPQDKAARERWKQTYDAIQSDRHIISLNQFETIKNDPETKILMLRKLYRVEQKRGNTHRLFPILQAISEEQQLLKQRKLETIRRQYKGARAP